MRYRGELHLRAKSFLAAEIISFLTYRRNDLAFKTHNYTLETSTYSNLGRRFIQMTQKALFLADTRSGNVMSHRRPKSDNNRNSRPIGDNSWHPTNNRKTRWTEGNIRIALMPGRHAFLGFLGLALFFVWFVTPMVLTIWLNFPYLPLSINRPPTACCNPLRRGTFRHSIWSDAENNHRISQH